MLFFINFKVFIRSRGCKNNGFEWQTYIAYFDKTKTELFKDVSIHCYIILKL